MKLFSRRNVLTHAVAAVSATALGQKLIVAAQAHGSPTTHIVEIQNFKFSPDDLTVHVEDTITWINKDIAPHTATAKDKRWDTGVLKQGESKSLVVTDAMAGGYGCTFHTMMKAKLVVENCMK